LDETSSTGQKLIDFYNQNNIQLYDQDGQLRSLYDTLYDVSQIWDTLSENEQKYFLNIQAGANQSVQLGALMQNFDTAIEATNTALNSSGSAMQENEAYMESLNKMGLLKTTLTAGTSLELSLLNYIGDNIMATGNAEGIVTIR